MSVEVGAKAPDFTRPDQDSANVTLSEERNGVVRHREVLDDPPEGALYERVKQALASVRLRGSATVLDVGYVARATLGPASGGCLSLSVPREFWSRA